MGLIDRTSRLVRASLNSSKNVVPHELFDHHTNSDVKQTLMELCQAVRQAIETEWQIQKQIDKAQIISTIYQQRAQAALQLSDNNSARDALLQKRQQSVAIIGLEKQLEEQTSLLKLLNRRLTDLEEKFPLAAQQVETEFSVSSDDRLADFFQ
jgi:phage shock protein A